MRRRFFGFAARCNLGMPTSTEDLLERSFPSLDIIWNSGCSRDNSGKSGEGVAQRSSFRVRIALNDARTLPLNRLLTRLCALLISNRFLRGLNTLCESYAAQIVCRGSISNYPCQRGFCIEGALALWDRLSGLS